MAPLLRRTWSPLGTTPVLLQKTNSHKKVSVIGALGVNVGKRQHAKLYFRLHPNQNVSASLALAFLRLLVRQIRGHIIVVWDRFAAHRAQKVVAYAKKIGRLHLVWLPPYAPELNPIECCWGYWKRNPLANLAAADLDKLADVVRHHGRVIQRRRGLLVSLLRRSPLSLSLLGHY
jgi:putative transposase